MDVATETPPTGFWTAFLKPRIWHYGRRQLVFFEPVVIIFGWEGGAVEVAMLLSWLDLTDNLRTHCGSDLSITREPLGLVEVLTYANWLSAQQLAIANIFVQVGVPIPRTAEEKDQYFKVTRSFCSPSVNWCVNDSFSSVFFSIFQRCFLEEVFQVSHWMQVTAIRVRQSPRENSWGNCFNCCVQWHLWVIVL